jgi:VWFA-related protein
MEWIVVGKYTRILVFFLALAASVNASVTIEGDSTSYNVAIGDTLSVTSRQRLIPGENFIRWEIVSGTGAFTDETADSSGFIPSSSDAVVRMVTQTLPTYEISEHLRILNFYKNSTKIPMSSQYGIRMNYKATEDGQFAFIYKASQGLTPMYFAGDSTFSKTAATNVFSANTSCTYTSTREVKCVFNATANTDNYFCAALAYYPNHDMKDSASFGVARTHTVSVAHSGQGLAYIDSLNLKALSYSKIIDLDSIKIYTVPDTDYVFDHWEVSSGTCSIRDTKKETTLVYDVKTDCKVNAVFVPGTIYTITSTPTQYNFTENTYAKKISSGHSGVRFTFTAPSDGSYTFITSTDFSSDSIYYLRYTNSTYSTLAQNKKFNGTVSDKLTLTAGQVVSIVVSNSSNKKDNPFYINYASQAYKVVLGTDGNGTTKPAAGYDTAYAGSKYSISAEANAGYRFSDWQVVAGSPVIEDSEAPSTYVSVSGNAELKARFKASSVYPLTKTKQKFNFQKNYYGESTLSTIRFSWTPPDTATYLVSFEPVDPIGGIFSDYGTDSTFANVEAESAVSGTMSFTIKGSAGIPLYLTLQDSAKNIPNKSFKAWISTPYVLNVLTAKEGSVNPSGKVYTAPGAKTILTAWPYGGYKFKSWVNTEGDMTIFSPKNSRTSVTLKDSLCSVKATFANDESAEPLLSISKLDIGNYPEICVQVSVTDKNSGHSFYGLVSDDFTLTQDGNSVQPQVTSINNVTGVSVVIVVDESSSMTVNNRMTKAKEAIRKFVENMGPYDKTAIVGFRGYDSTTVHQAMTSDKFSLINAIDSISAVADMTNIITGTIAGLNQIVNETNPTAVIVFSDGDSNSGSRDVRGTVKLAKDKKTTIYSIALESETKYPLENLALGSGGTFSIASDAEELAGLYAGIRDNILSQYVVCYQTPDTLQNGETHNVVLSTKFNKITTIDKAQWDEKAIPPVITLTDDTWDLINHSQDSNNPLTLSVYIKSLVGISFADVYVRTSGTNGGFSRYSLQNVRDSLWEFTVPASLVMAPGLDFFVIAADALGQTGKSPRIQNPANQPYTIFVDNDIPSIEAVSVACEDSTSDLKTFRFSIKDSDGIDGATLYYKDSRAVIFQEIPLTYSGKDDSWAAEFRANVRDYDMLFYYLRVMDAKGATVRHPGAGSLATEACRIHYVDDPDTSVSDSVPEDSILSPSPRDSIVYSLIADSAEMYDKDLDGRADYVRVHFKEERDDNITNIDSIFWNSNRGEWRYVPEGTIKQDRSDGTWFGAYINKPYKYGLTKADSAHPPFLAFTTVYSEDLENVKLLDRVGAVPARATKFPGNIGLEEYMDPNLETPPDTLIVTLSEPIVNVGGEKGWEKLFRYSESCDDTVTYPLNFRQAPKIRDNGQQWVLVLDDYSVKTGFCLSTDPSATYEDLAGNAMGRGGIKVDGKDGSLYLAEVRPLQAVSGIGKTPKWIPPGGDEWESLPDSLSAISVKATMPYTAEVYIFDGISTYVTHFKQKFGYDGEMDQSIRGKPGELFRQGYLHWNKRSEKGRHAGTGVYIWKIFFKFEDGHKETRIVKTGIYRRGHKKK